jgi:hypothetical protein
MECVRPTVSLRYRLFGKMIRVFHACETADHFDEMKEAVQRALCGEPVGAGNAELALFKTVWRKHETDELRGHLFADLDKFTEDARSFLPVTFEPFWTRSNKRIRLA